MQLTILGCGSARPKEQVFNSAQVLETGNKAYMIDCGDGAQIRFLSAGIRQNKLHNIFISHLHGDHCFGLTGLISTLAMLGRKQKLTIHAHADLEKLLQPQIKYFCRDMAFEVEFHHINPQRHELIYEDKTVEVYSLPLRHGVPTCGFLFREKAKDRHLRPEKIAFYNIPVRELQHIKKGADFTTEDGSVVPNAQLTSAPTPSKSYAYCADTAFCEKLVPLIKSIDCLYHEATFAQTENARAKETMHCTAAQAAEIARLSEVKQLLIGHYSARYASPKLLLAEAQEIFENTVAVKDKMTIEI